jgi:nucleotide-binding universal stress UspA family protein
MFQKILLPTDGSRYSAEAARIAAEVAAKHGGVVQPLVTVEFEHLLGGDLTEDVIAAVRGRIEARAQKALDDAATAIQSAGGKASEGKILEGPAPNTIVQEAEDGEYDLIVMGSRGVSEEDGHERLIGSVTERVLHRSPCPVLVIRAEPRP